MLRNYEGMLVRYQAEDKPNTGQADRHARRQRRCCKEPRAALIPENNERMARRRELNVITNARSAHEADAEGSTNGCCGGHGHNGNGHAKEHGYHVEVLANGCGS